MSFPANIYALTFADTSIAHRYIAIEAGTFHFTIHEATLLLASTVVHVARSRRRLSGKISIELSIQTERVYDISY